MIPAGWPRVLLAAAVAALAAGAALPAGGATAAGQLATRLGAFALLALAAGVHSGGPGWRRVALPLGAFGALAGLALFQAASLPSGLVGWISPAHAELTARARDLLAAGGSTSTLSLAPGLSRAAAMALLAAAAVFCAAFVAGAPRWGRRVLAVGLVAGAVFQVLFGARDWLAGSAPRLHGTFVNPNHLAYVLEIALALSFAWAVWAARAQRYAVTLERRLALVAPPVAGWLLLAAGLLATGSRTGIAAAVAGLLVQSLLLRRALGGERRDLALKALAAAALAAFGLFVVRGAGRLAETTLFEVAWGDRAVVWRECVALWRRFPLTGTGLGTFGEAFPLVQPAAMTELYWRRAHNDPLELLVTGGLVGLVLGLVAALGAGRALARVLRHGERAEDRMGALAALGAAGSVAVHEVMDFGLTLPGVALPLAAVAGAAAAARLTTRSRSAAPGPDAAADGRTHPRPAGAASPGRP